MKRLLTTLAFSGALSLFGADERTASEFAADLGPGISLGYSLEIPSGDETAWGNPTISERQIEACRALGATEVPAPASGRNHLPSGRRETRGRCSSCSSGWCGRGRRSNRSSIVAANPAASAMATLCSGFFATCVSIRCMGSARAAGIAVSSVAESGFSIGRCGLTSAR